MKTLELTRYRDCEQALKIKSLRQALYDEGAVLMDRVLVTLHGEEHHTRRMTEMRVFRRDFFRQYEHEVIPRIFDEVIASIDDESVDLVNLGYRFMVFLGLAFAGVDRQTQTRQELDTLIEMLRMFGVAATLGQAKDRDREAAARAVQETIDEFDRRFFTPSAERRQALINDVAAGRLAADDLPMDVLTCLLQDDQAPDLDRDLLLRETAYFFLASAHTSVHSLTHALHHLFEWVNAHPESRDRLIEDPILVQRFVHESFRLHPSSPVSKRAALEAVELPDSRVAQPGDIVIVNLREANREPEVFGENPAAFDPYREIARGVGETGITFGIGMHACLGKNLAAGKLPVPGRPVDLAGHQLGTVARICHSLLRAGVIPDHDHPPELDRAIARETWLRYPAVLPAKEDRSR